MSPPYLRRKPRGQRTYRAAGPAMHEEHSREESLRKLREMIEGIEIAILTTIDADGCLHGRPMATQAMDEEGVLWFYTADYAPKVQEVLLHAEVCVNYAAPDTQSYVSVSGKAELVHEPEKLKEFWKPELQAWFPQGLADPNLSLLRVDVESAQYWDASASKLVRLLERARAAGTGEAPPPPANGSSHKLTLKHRIAPDNIS
jgi:general stress protein 26